MLLGHGRTSRGQRPLSTDTVGGTLGFLSSLLPQLNHESGPPGPQTDVLGLVVACHPARQQPLHEQEETQGYVCRREDQAKAWRVSERGISCMTRCGAASAVKMYLLVFCGFMGGFETVCCFTVSSQIWLRNEP